MIQFEITELQFAIAIVFMILLFFVLVYLIEHWYELPIERLQKENIKLATMTNYYWVNVSRGRTRAIECRNKFTEQVVAKIKDTKGKAFYSCIYRKSQPIQFSIFANTENNMCLIKDLEKLLGEDCLPYPPKELLLKIHKWSGQTLTQVAASLMIKPGV